MEGIEDIDIYNANDITAVQCKYLSKSKLTNSVIREPILLMLDNFIKNNCPQNLKYNLYAHFDDEIAGTEYCISLSNLKKILSYKEKGTRKIHHIDNNISDQQLNSFLTNFKLIFALEFNDQQSSVISKLEKLFACSNFEADTYFYNNALRIIIDAAKETKIELIGEKLQKGVLNPSIS